MIRKCSKNSSPLPLPSELVKFKSAVQSRKTPLGRAVRLCVLPAYKKKCRLRLFFFKLVELGTKGSPFPSFPLLLFPLIITVATKENLQVVSFGIPSLSSLHAKQPKELYIFSFV